MKFNQTLPSPLFFPFSLPPFRFPTKLFFYYLFISFQLKNKKNLKLHPHRLSYPHLHIHPYHRSRLLHKVVDFFHRQPEYASALGLDCSRPYASALGLSPSSLDLMF
ncbi:hypothetical protein L6452_26393 [Arctium lappa]|uniref:Uncharacterized protein n=1 Tax=Arctium lappa TaxID=4217 RepID=A0ACB8ZUI5_ARCLA|nr:hypothetical protein L6452_26393 [Arctium lappa]